MTGLPDDGKFHMFSYFSKVYKRDGQRNGWTDRNITAYTVTALHGKI